MAKSVAIADLGKIIGKELTIYHEDVVKRINLASKKAAKELVAQTKATAPMASGYFESAIASKMLEKSRLGNETYVWYVKPPEHRLTHLLVHGHATRNGGRTKADPFLRNALDRVLPEFEKAVEEAVKNA